MKGGRLKDAPNIVIWLGNFWYFGQLVAEGESGSYKSWFNKGVTKTKT